MMLHTCDFGYMRFPRSGREDHSLISAQGKNVRSHLNITKGQRTESMSIITLNVNSINILMKIKISNALLCDIFKYVL
jgi:hypothetical protein